MKAPSISICFVQAERRGIECAMKDNSTVFLRWDPYTERKPDGTVVYWPGLKEGFLERFDKGALTSRDDFMALVDTVHQVAHPVSAASPKPGTATSR